MVSVHSEAQGNRKSSTHAKHTVLLKGGSMESRLHVKSSQMKNPSQCKLTRVTLLSPLGKIQAAGCGNGVHYIQLQEDAVPAERNEMASFACVVCEGQEGMTAQLQLCTEWLQAYFCNPRTIEKLPLPALHHPIFQEATFTSRVLQTLLRDVKFGETVSYKHLAEMAGNSKAVRAVGGAMRRNPIPLLVPCHRVISCNGEIGNYMGGKGNHLKQWLLTHEKL
ncbi:methylated-DNA--protein-cysteine methyltransferase isoform X2 [Lepisosteus oculatus]|uniref:methylated-DNA--protein-cysteine methyltransferase isoform X2 n=1 Tax=Lepisosteus oculatus TaxID=7918 RepID=UPI0007403DCF|nr:PREDICTED: methylated-DNA--protein-cysteine methyltransferase isoform X2 [Lepisosteus oculatus]